MLLQQPSTLERPQLAVVIGPDMDAVAGALGAFGPPRGVLRAA